MELDKLPVKPVNAVKQANSVKEMAVGNYKIVPYGIVNINANLLQSQGYTGRGVVLAILDTGIADRPDFGGRVISHDNMTNAARPGSAHGTHVCGTAIAYSTNPSGPLVGVATETLVRDIQIIGPNGGSDSQFARGIDKAIAYGVDVINMSVGTPNNNSVINNAVKRAYDAGIILVSAAGNDGRGTIMYPGALDQCISVGNLNILTNIVDITSSTNRYVDCYAPGDNVFSTVPNGYALYSGTSMATPHVAGLCCCLLQKLRGENPTFTKQQLRDAVRNVLLNNVVNIGASCQAISAGCGVVRWQPEVTPSIKYIEISAQYYSYIVNH
jgi:subtilisin family serine protease